MHWHLLHFGHSRNYYHHFLQNSQEQELLRVLLMGNLMAIKNNIHEQLVIYSNKDANAMSENIYLQMLMGTCSSLVSH